MRLLRTVVFAAAALVAAATPRDAQSQDTAAVRQQLQQRGLTNADILSRIRQSGLSREQIRERLRQAGYDPTLADRYLDAATAPADTAGAAPSRFARPLEQPSGSLISALRRIGVLERSDSLAAPLPVRRDSARARARTARDSIDVFGRELFSASTTQFTPVMSGPVDPDYRLGPGDELTLILTGDVELAYTLTVTPEGYIVIPDVGQVLVAGLTLRALNDRLNDRLGRVYSGVSTGTTSFDVSMGRLRRHLVYLIGEVDMPGAYQVSGGATVFNALYLAGGPGDNGSFRSIQVRRDNRVIREVDLYRYLLAGDKSGDIRLEQGDIVFVPVTGRRVTVTGNVRRPAIFELREGEGLREVIMFAGGVQAEAAVERIQIDRILPANQRQPGRERVLVDVPVAQVLSNVSVPLADGDRIRVFSITDERRNRLTITGDVHRPGDYEYRRGMTALELVSAAQGLLPTAYTPLAHIVRLDPADSTTMLVQVSFDPAAPNYAGRVALEDLDEIVVFGRTRLSNPQRVEIFGLVKNEGAFDFSAGMTVEDLVLLAGGFTEGALDKQAEVARRIRGENVTDTLAQLFRVPMRLNVQGTNGNRDEVNRQGFALQPGDQVFIRPLPGFNPLRTVEISGEVVYPGSYTIEAKTERISRLLRRAGGLLPDAYAPGFRLFRDGQAVGVNLPRALREPGGAHDLMLEPGDRLEIPRYDPTVLVTGAVGFESRVRYERGLDVDDYLERAGGVRDDGDARRVSVRYPNGELRTSRSFFGVRSYPDVQPGSTITVPTRPVAARRNLDEILTRSLTILSTLATIIVTVRAVRD